jgi:transposase
MLLEGANLKHGSVLSNVPGCRGRAMLDAIVAGEDNPEWLARAGPRQRAHVNTELREALRGRVTPHHRERLKLHPQVINTLHCTLAKLGASLGKEPAPIRQFIRLLTTIPALATRPPGSSGPRSMPGHDAFPRCRLPDLVGGSLLGGTR